MGTYVIQDSATMLRRNFRHILRYPSVSLMVVGIPVILLLLFVYVFGGTLGAGLGVEATGRTAYVDYVMPGILLIAIAGSAQSAASRPGRRSWPRRSSSCSLRDCVP
jgi:ABC-2 type transport system permease protein